MSSIRLRFDEFAEMVNDRVDNPADSGLSRYVGLEHLDPGVIRISRTGSTDDVGTTKFRFRAEDVIYARRNPHLRKAGLADFDGIASAHSLVLRAVSTVCTPEYLANFLISATFSKRAMAISVGSLSRTINWRDLRVQEFDLPSLDEQRRVVEVMRAVDQEIAAAEKVLQAAVTAGASMVAPAAGTPTSLGNALSLITKGTTPTSLGMGFEESGIRFVKTESIVSGRVDPSLCAWISPNTHAALGRSQIQKGDVLLSIAGTVGRVAIATEDLLPANCNQAIAILRPEPSLDARYLAAWLGTREAQEQMSRSKAATTIFNLSMTLIKQLKIALPDLQSQRAFAWRAAIHSEMVARAQAGVASSLALRTSLLQELIG